jgi:vacuolar-type H+-ATPase subunit I/STV1
MIGSRRLEELEDEARYHRDRYDLYKAKSYGPKLTSAARLSELERRCQSAESRLRHAREEIAELARQRAEEP